MSLPKINITFKGKAETMIKRSERGIVALLLKDKTNKLMEYKSIIDSMDDLSDENKKFLELAFRGSDAKPRKIIVVSYVDKIEKGLELLETVKFQYLAVPGALDEDLVKIEVWTKEMIDEKDFTFQTILANSKSDHEAIINFTTDIIVMENDDVYTSSEFTARIAGLLGGTPLNKSATYAILHDVKEVERISKSDADKRIDAGEFILINDGENVKVGRAVTSLTTTSEDKSSQWKKILIVQKMFMWKDDVRTTIAENYVGRYANTYDNKCLLITDIRLYNKELEKLGILDNSDIGYNNVVVNIQAQKDYLESIGELDDSMSEDDIKKANTKDKVFISTNLKYTDAMEDFEIAATI